MTNVMDTFPHVAGPSWK